MKILDNLFDKIYSEDVALTGMTEELFAVYVDKLYDNKKNILIVTSNLVESNSLYRSISNYTDNVYLFPMDDFLTSEAMAISPDLMVTRLETLKEISSDRPSIVITNLMGYLRYLPLKKEYLKGKLSLKVNNEISPKELVEKLINIGYERTTLVTKTGEIGVRGFVIDIFPLDGYNPENEEQNKKNEENFYLLRLQTQRRFEGFKILPEKQEKFKISDKKYGKMTNYELNIEKEKIAKQYDYDKCKYVKSYYSDFADNTPIPKEIFEKGELKPFESIMANIPQGYDEYLERLYGDYMKLPPENKRKGEHFKSVRWK